MTSIKTVLENKTMKNAALAAALALSAAACRTAPPAVPAPHLCEATPHSIVTDAKGAPTHGVYFCYEANNGVTYETRTLTLEQLAALTAPAVKPAAAAAAAPVIAEKPAHARGKQAR